jgi:predicted nucleic acid-binding protein
MKRKVLLDTNMLIGTFDHDPNNSRHVEARKDFRALLADENVDLVITPLVSYEVLRKPTRVSPADLEAKLSRIQSLPIREEEACRAAELFRLAESKNMNLDKRSFDLFHCVCAEVNGLEVASQDPHIKTIKDLIRDNPRTDSRQP